MFTFPFSDLTDYDLKTLYLQNVRKENGDMTQLEDYAYVYYDGCWYSCD
jgi:hypothetical protein